MLKANEEVNLIRKFNYYHDESSLYQKVSMDSSLIYLDSTLTIAAQIKDPYYLGKALQLKSGLHFYQNELDSARIYSRKSIDILVRYPDSSAYFRAEYNLGNIYCEMDDYIQALVQYKKVLRIINENFETLIETDGQFVNLNRAYAYVSIGFVYDHLGDYENELDNLKKGIKITYKVNSKESEILRAVTLGNIGAVYFELGDYESAESYAITGMEQKKKFGLEASIGYNFQVLAKAAYGRGKMDLCLKYLEQADKKFEISANKTEKSRNNFWRAKTLMRMGDFDQASKILLELEIIYKNGFSKKEQADLYDLLSEVNAAQGDYKKANEYLLVSRMLRREIDLKNDKKMVGEFLGFFEEEEIRLNDRIESLKNKQEKEKLELEIAGSEERRVWVYSLFLVSIICLILIIFIIAKAYKRNKRINLELSNSIDEKQILFKEVHHRVKNNFQIISSLLNLQQGIEEDERGKKVLSDAQGRIRSMSLVHEMLYRKNDVKRIDFTVYTEELVSSILHSFAVDDKEINYRIISNNESFDLEVAVPLGLILNEAITNSVKYAFEGRSTGNIKIILTEKENAEYELLIRDDGIGIPEEFINGSKETLGIELINILTEQIGGSVEIRNNNGTEIQLTFKAD